MKKYTPGPWVICAEDGCKEPASSIFAESQLNDVCTWDDAIANAGLNHINVEANARLIAAAPDLLEALKAYRDAIHFALDKQALMAAISDADAKASAAIAKAEAA